MITVTKLCYAIRATRLAPVFVAVDAEGRLAALRFLDPDAPERVAEELLARHRKRGEEPVENARACADVLKQVKTFLARQTKRFDVVLVPRGTTFQAEVWRALRAIPYGKTISYGELAERIGRPTAVRAVARANATNPVALVVPCHRVVGSDGSVTGYNGGIAVKEALLAMEAAAK